MIKHIFAIHQPNYLPWIGYFYKIAKVDTFIFLDSVQFPRGQSFANRNRIKTPQGIVYLTIPLSYPKGKEKKVSYREMEFASDKWKEKHLKILRFNYKRAPYFDPIYNMVKSVLDIEALFYKLNIKLIKKVSEYLDFETKFALLSDILENFGSKTQLIVDIGKAIGGQVYYSGTGGGKEYNDENLLNKNEITLEYSDFIHPTYPQLWDGFMPNLSIIDLLFNCGPESKNILLGTNQ